MDLDFYFPFQLLANGISAVNMRIAVTLIVMQWKAKQQQSSNKVLDYKK